MSISQEVLSYIKQKKNIPRGMYREIQKEGTLTGSFLFKGAYTKESDIDVLIPVELYEKYKELINMSYAVYDYNNEEYEEYFQSIYVKDPKGRILNLCLFTDEFEYEKHVWATKILRKMRGVKEFDELMKDKKYRTAMFELHKAHSPGALREFLSESLNNYKGTGDDVPF